MTKTTEDEQLQSIVYFLSDHICTVIESGDAIMAEQFEADPTISQNSAKEILRGFDDFYRFLDRLRHYEYLILTRLSQARNWAAQLRSLDPEFRPVIDLFSTTTNIASDAATLLGEDNDDIFNGAGDPDLWMSSRGLVVKELSTDGTPSKVYCDENYLLGGKVLLSSLLEMCETFHDTMETRYAVFNEGDIEETPGDKAADLAKKTND